MFAETLRALRRKERHAPLFRQGKLAVGPTKERAQQGIAVPQGIETPAGLVAGLGHFGNW